MRRTLENLLDQNTADLVNYFGRSCTRVYCIVSRGGMISWMISYNGEDDAY